MYRRFFCIGQFLTCPIYVGRIKKIASSALSLHRKKRLRYVLPRYRLLLLFLLPPRRPLARCRMTMFPFLLLLFVFPWAPSSLSLSSTVGQGEEGTKFARFGRRKTTCPSKGIIKDEWGHCFAAAFEFGDFHTARREGEREGGVEGERGADGAKEKTKGGKRWSHEGGKRERERGSSSSSSRPVSASLHHYLSTSASKKGKDSFFSFVGGGNQWCRMGFGEREGGEGAIQRHLSPRHFSFLPPFFVGLIFLSVGSKGRLK